MVKAGHRVGVLGATSMVGQNLLRILVKTGWCVEAFSRQPQVTVSMLDKNDSSIIFQPLGVSDCGDVVTPVAYGKGITHWVCLAPIWVLPNYFPVLAAHRAKRVVALSSTSLFTKKTSSDLVEQNTAEKLLEGERRLTTWAEANGIEWVILRPTMIYGLGRDRNICEIARFIASFRFFPLLGAAQGLRQPVHAEDVASACVAALQSTRACNHAYNLSGAETLPYREMVARVFRGMGRQERFVVIPFFIFRLAVACLRIWPRFRSWSPAMAERMNADLVFSHADASRDLGFSPKPFQPVEADLPVS